VEVIAHVEQVEASVVGCDRVVEQFSGRVLF
jgi:hypothetical protein